MAGHVELKITLPSFHLVMYAHKSDAAFTYGTDRAVKWKNLFLSAFYIKVLEVLLWGIGMLWYLPLGDKSSGSVNRPMAKWLQTNIDTFKLTLKSHINNLLIQLIQKELYAVSGFTSLQTSMNM